MAPSAQKVQYDRFGAGSRILHGSSHADNCFTPNQECDYRAQRLEDALVAYTRAVRKYFATPSAISCAESATRQRSMSPEALEASNQTGSAAQVNPPKATPSKSYVELIHDPFDEGFEPLLSSPSENDAEDDGWVLLSVGSDGESADQDGQADGQEAWSELSRLVDEIHNLAMCVAREEYRVKYSI